MTPYRSEKKQFITEDEAMALLRDRCRSRGGAATLAERAGVSRCSISLMLSGRRRIGPRLAACLDLRPVRGFIAAKRSNDL